MAMDGSGKKIAKLDGRNWDNSSSQEMPSNNQEERIISQGHGQLKQKTPQYSFVGDEAVNVKEKIPVPNVEERIKDTCKIAKSEERIEDTCKTPSDMEVDPTEDNSETNKTKEGLLESKCRGCGEHKERLLRHLSSMVHCKKRYTVEEIERHQQAVTKKWKDKANAKHYKKNAPAIKASKVKHHKENAPAIKATRVKHYKENAPAIKATRVKHYKKNAPAIKATRVKHHK